VGFLEKRVGEFRVAMSVVGANRTSRAGLAMSVDWVDRK
jgi:hypothetical protein